jgi:DNA-binding response OmpR family regulator
MVSMADKPSCDSEIAALLRGALVVHIRFEPSEHFRVAQVLGSAGALVIEATLASQAVGCCQAVVASVSVLDQLRQRRRATPPMLIAGTPEDIALRAASQPLTGVDFLTSPWAEGELLFRTFRLIASSKRAQARVIEPGRPRVLIADDDPNITNLLKMTLGNRTECEVARNGLAAIRAVRDFPPDAVILDVNMPILNGFEVLEAIRSDPGLRQLPVILLTASDDQAHVAKGLALGATDYVVKPFGLNALLQRIRRILGGPAASATLEGRGALLSGPAL